MMYIPKPSALKMAASVITGIKVLSDSKKKSSAMCQVKTKNNTTTRHIPHAVLNLLKQNNVKVDSNGI